MISDWHHLLGTYTGVALLTAATAPLAILLTCTLALRRSTRNTTHTPTSSTPPTPQHTQPASTTAVPRHISAVPRRTSAWVWWVAIADVGMVYGTVPWVWMTMLPGSGAGEVPGRLSLVPLRDLLSMSPLQIVGNLLVFAALGFFAPLRFARLASIPRVLGLAAGCSVLIELAQYVLRLDRVTSVDDVLLNALGAGLAALASRPWWHSTFRGHIENRIRTGNTTSP